MAILDESYEVAVDSLGLALIEVTGRCTEDEAADIEGDCTKRYEMVALPNASGAILKSLDGTVPQLVEVEHPLSGRSYNCVKVLGIANSFAPAQVGGPYDGNKILAFMIRYQEVGGVS